MYIKCSECDKKIKIEIEKRTIEDNLNLIHLAPDEIYEEVFNLGWFVHRKGTICPTCYEVNNVITIRKTA